MNNLQVITDDIYSTRESFAAVVSDKDINFEREAGFAIQALSKNDFSIRIATNARQSVIDAVTNIAAIGISLNPAKKQAYLVPRDGKICLDISYMGLMDLAMATGSIKWAQASLVRAKDTFTLNGFDKPPEHRFNPFDSDRGDTVGVYVVVKTADGEYLTHTMTYQECMAIRDRSQAWKSFKSGSAKSGGPWASDEGEMIKKTCVKQAYKYWPKTDRLETAIHHLNTDGAEGVAFVEAAPTVQPIPAALLQAARDAAMNGSTAYAAFFQATGKENRKLLAPEHESLKASARRADVPVAPAPAMPPAAPDISDAIDKNAINNQEPPF